MLKITRYSIPAILAVCVVMGRGQDASGQAQQQQPPRQAGQTALPGQPGYQQRPLTTPDQRNQQSILQPGQAGQIGDAQWKRQVTEVNRASSFIGMAVKNAQDESLGKINDLVFDPQSGKISYAVVSVGGLLGVGDKLIAVPLNSLKAQAGQKHLVLNMDKNQLQAAPGLAQHHWPDLDAVGLGGAAGSESGTDALQRSSPFDPNARPQSGTLNIDPSLDRPASASGTSPTQPQPK